MYAKLRTNLPREVMAYTDFAFDDLAGQSQDTRRLPSHEEVCHLLSHTSITLCEQCSKFVLLAAKLQRLSANSGCWNLACLISLSGWELLATCCTLLYQLLKVQTVSIE